MTTIAVLPVLIQQFCDDNGVALAGGLLYSYEAGTAYAILQPLYQDATLDTPFPNPITLDAYGRPPGPMFALTAPAYDIIVTNVNGVMVWTA